MEYCPTGDMVADFFTKPLQGSLFRKLRKIILNLTEERVIGDATISQECVDTAPSYADIVRGTRHTNSSVTKMGTTSHASRSTSVKVNGKR